MSHTHRRRGSKADLSRRKGKDKDLMEGRKQLLKSHKQLRRGVRTELRKDYL